MGFRWKQRIIIIKIIKISTKTIAVPTESSEQLIIMKTYKAQKSTKVLMSLT